MVLFQKEIPEVMRRRDDSVRGTDAQSFAPSKPTDQVLPSERSRFHSDGAMRVKERWSCNDQSRRKESEVRSLMDIKQIRFPF